MFVWAPGNRPQQSLHRCTHTGIIINDNYLNTVTPSSEVMRALSSLEAAKTRTSIPIRHVLRRLNPMLPARKSVCVRNESRPPSALWERADSLPDCTRKEGCCRRLVQHQPSTFRELVFPVCPNLSMECLVGLRSRATTICLPT